MQCHFSSLLILHYRSSYADRNPINHDHSQVDWVSTHVHTLTNLNTSLQTFLDTVIDICAKYNPFTHTKCKYIAAVA